MSLTASRLFECNAAVKREQSNVFELPSVSSIAFSNAKIQNKNAVCKFFPKIGTTKLFFNTFLSVFGKKGKNMRRVGVGWHVGLGVRVSFQTTPTPAHILCLSMSQLIGWSVFRFQ